MIGAERAVITLPVVVHIIHDNGAENLSDAQVIQGIADLNAPYANTGYYDQGTGVNAEIQFCLAVRTPNGNATTGINRVQNVLTDVIAETQDIALKDLSRWDPLSYINIWLVRSITSASYGAGPTGYAYLPVAHGQPMDGIVVEAEFFGSSSSNAVVGIHEIGHYLGLYHTFEGGCTNNDCLSDGDRVCDTPPDGSTASIACNETLNSCSTDSDDSSTNNPFRPVSMGGLGDQPDDLTNYMDYGSYYCKNAFTQGQKDRMQGTLSVARQSLLNSNGCISPCSIPFTASFTVSPTPPVTIGTALQLTNTTGAATGFTWLVNGAFLSNNVNETYQAATEGIYTIRLIAEDSVNHCLGQADQAVEISCPGDATFTVDNLTLPVGGTALFTNTSTSSTVYTWYLDGSAYSAQVNESITFTTPGVYSVYLVAHTPECENTSVTQYIQVGNCGNDGYRMNWFFGTNSAMNFSSGTPQV
ncbi:MAG: M43 family zinc metalloprotease, partial [Flavobacteriales bacterium]